MIPKIRFQSRFVRLLYRCVSHLAGRNNNCFEIEVRGNNCCEIQGHNKCNAGRIWRRKHKERRKEPGAREGVSMDRYRTYILSSTDSWRSPLETDEYLLNKRDDSLRSLKS